MKTLTTLFLLIITTFFINAQTIEIKKGFGGYRYFQNGEKVKVWKLNQLMEDKEALRLLNSAKTYRSVGGLVGLVGGFIVGWELGNVIWRDEKLNWRTLTVGFGVSVVSFSFDSIVNKRRKEAVNIYNAQFDSSSFRPSTPQLKLVANTNKVGLTLDF